jgi:16S rRNA (adenine1518-N6/adenine1519-N6)-dimethyltransferase
MAPFSAAHSAMNGPETKSGLRALLDAHHLVLSKRYGQNFLVDPETLAALGAFIPAREDTMFIEIGTGALALTLELAKKGKRVVSYELDARFSPLHRDVLAGEPNARHIELVCADALEVDWCSIAAPGETPVLTGNLPYLRSSEVVLKLIHSTCINEACLLFQKEFAERIAARAGTHAYGSLTVAVQTFFAVEQAMVLPPEVFFPQPTVSSALLIFHRRPHDLTPAEVRPYLGLVQQAFLHRRKKLVDFFRRRGAAITGPLVSLADLRAENLTPEDFVALYRELKSRGRP